jgi:hypothetical protein
VNVAAKGPDVVLGEIEGPSCVLYEPDDDDDGIDVAIDVVSLSNGFKIWLLEIIYNEDGTSTWRYWVEELAGAQDLSNWVLELPDCVTVVDAFPGLYELVDPDPNAGLIGIKWETEEEFESGEFVVTLDGHWVEGSVNVAAKGPDVAWGLIAGPICQEDDDSIVVGGSDQGISISITIDTTITTQVTYLFRQSVSQTVAGITGRIFFLLRVLGEPGLEEYVFVRPNTAYLAAHPGVGFLRVFSGPGGAVVANFTELYLSQQILATTTEDLALNLGNLSGFVGLRIVLTSAYLIEETSEFETIQEVELDIQ